MISPVWKQGFQNECTHAGSLFKTHRTLHNLGNTDHCNRHYAVQNNSHRGQRHHFLKLSLSNNAQDNIIYHRLFQDHRFIKIHPSMYYQELQQNTDQVYSSTKPSSFIASKSGWTTPVSSRERHTSRDSCFDLDRLPNQTNCLRVFHRLINCDRKY